jgi:hypothetical protein
MHNPMAHALRKPVLMRPPRLACYGVGLGLTALASSCGPFSPTPTGELGNGQFVYQCPGNNVDPGCSGTLSPPTSPEASTGLEDEDAGSYEDATPGTTRIPSVIAVGALFSVAYTALDGTNNDDETQGDTGSGYQVTPASPRLAIPQGGALIALRPGFEALLAATGGVSQVDDFIFVRFATIASLTAARSTVLTSVGGKQTLSVTAQDANQEILAGRLQCSWTIASGGEAVLFQGPTDGAAVAIEGTALGEARVKATCGSATTEVLVTVATSVPEGGPPDGGTEGSPGDTGAKDGGHDAGEAKDSGHVEGGDHG